MRVDLTKWMSHDKSIQVDSKRFMGTSVQSLGNLQGHAIQILIEGLPIPSKKFGTYEEAKQAENDIWEAMGGDK